MSQTILETHGTIPMYQLLYKKKTQKKHTCLTRFNSSGENKLEINFVIETAITIEDPQ